MATRTPPRPRRGFTLIETMMVVAIIAVLSSVAIPLFQRYLLQVRQTEKDLYLLPLLREAMKSHASTGRCPDGSDNLITDWSLPLSQLSPEKQRPDPIHPDRWAHYDAAPVGYLYGSYAVGCNLEDPNFPYVWSWVSMDLDGDGRDFEDLELYVNDGSSGWTRHSISTETTHNSATGVF